MSQGFGPRADVGAANHRAYANRTRPQLCSNEFSLGRSLEVLTGMGLTDFESLSVALGAKATRSATAGDGLTVKRLRSTQSVSARLGPDSTSRRRAGGEALLYRQCRLYGCRW